uniref:Endothelin-converting enzyme n=1 Tax=Kwoniella bestiolae CBS 10118 TaxID=1296100 RepID=A0A1B9FRG9_9TREE|nr:endothelin-converting enzyme [Kwoniella bestiolae CBS 10118]OCF21365.1 endothelin-converting enzyme [Kwoniella bestiolae CBS 10118]
MAQPRASTDEENAPLLDNPNSSPSESSSPLKAIFSPSRPLTLLEKVLGGLAVLLLLLASIFIGLFAGAEGLLKKERNGHGHGHGGKTEYATSTFTATTTSYGTTTVIPAPGPTGKPDSKLCLTPECVILSSSILQSLNQSVDPCEDFYEFATGGWQASHSIPADRGLYGAFNEVNDNNKNILIKVLDSISSDKPSKDASADEKNLAKLKAVYNSCIDIEHLNEVGRKPLIQLTDHIVDIFGEFDVDSLSSSDLLDESAEWKGTFDESYTVPADLVASAEEAEQLRQSKKTGGVRWEVPSSRAEGVQEFYEYRPNEEREERITKTLAWLHSRGVQGLVNFEIEGDAGGEDSQVQSLWLYQAFGGLPSKEYYEEKPILDLYQSVVAGILTDIAEHTSIRERKDKRDLLSDLEVAVELGQEDAKGLIEELLEAAEEEDNWPWPWPGSERNGSKDGNGKHDGGKTSKEPTDERMEKLAAKVVHFERELMRAGADPEYLFNPHYAYNPYSTKTVGKMLPFLDIPTYLSTFSPRSYPVNITVTHPPYLKSVTNLIDKTPDHVLSGYFVTRLALTYASALGPKVTIRQEKKRLDDVLKGIKKGTEENRQDVCLNWVDEIVGFIAGREFVREAFSPEAKAEGEHIINSIVKAFHEKLPHIPWMDAESARAAQKKAEAIIPKVGYPLYPNTTNPESLENWYGRLDIKENDFFGNVLGSTLLEESRTWLGLGRKRNRDSWEMYPQTVNAYYSPPDGEIVFPAGILQPPFYSQAWPAHLRYGAFGAVAAHELTHAFDNSGSQYDERGRLRDWWTKQTVKDFEERAQCVARQYSKYYVFDGEGKKVYVNGNLTNGEDIADSGLAQAFLAWQNSVSSSSSKGSEKLPGLDFSDEQLFFLAFARVWAQLTRPATAVSRVRTDPHSPPYWRATGTLKNLGAFHEAFGCKVGSPMNPPKKDQCELW